MEPPIRPTPMMPSTGFLAWFGLLTYHHGHIVRAANEVSGHSLVNLYGKGATPQAPAPAEMTIR
jgi:hypothetical protein